MFSRTKSSEVEGVYQTFIARFLISKQSLINTLSSAPGDCQNQFTSASFVVVVAGAFNYKVNSRRIET